jgi:hypothetical protein
MKFLYSDSLDFVDPDYDFLKDRSAASRRSHQHDAYPHEHLTEAPYDGLLISRAIVGDWKRPGKYSAAQCMRFSREGARAFLRYPVSRFPDSMVMGDCGAFSYRADDTPPYTVEEMSEFYADGGFTHGCSVDHVILDYVDQGSAPSSSARRRFDITLRNAELFLNASSTFKRRFKPLGVIQGWSPASMARASRSLVEMGYNYLAVGGMVPLKIRQIGAALEAIRLAIPARTKLHVLGFGKAEDLSILQRYRVTSFDTTSPLLRAFKDGKKNYYALGENGQVEYYMAIRIPQALDNAKVLSRAKRGLINQEILVSLEARALQAVRAFSVGSVALRPAVSDVIAYSKYAMWDENLDEPSNEKRLEQLRLAYSVTLNSRAWERCACRVCREIGVEAVIFRSSNRNKRRGIHNLYVFHSSLEALRKSQT